MSARNRAELARRVMVDCGLRPEQVPAIRKALRAWTCRKCNSVIAIGSNLRIPTHSRDGVACRASGYELGIVAQTLTWIPLSRAGEPVARLAVWRLRAIVRGGPNERDVLWANILSEAEPLHRRARDLPSLWKPGWRRPVNAGAPGLGKRA
jgi:hypothetical protein